MNHSAFDAPHHTRLLLAAVLLAAFFIRAAALDQIPPALNSDELLKAFDGASVWRTGRDHHGEPWPVFFKQSGEYSPPLYIYFAGVLAAPFGINAYTVRLPSAVLGTCSILAVFFYGRELWGRRAGLLAAFLVTLSPWHIHFSRMGWEAISYPLVLITALGCFENWARTRRWRSLAAATVGFALTFYTYPAARLYTPMIMLALAALHWKPLWRYRRQTAGAMALFGLAVLPFVAAMWRHAEVMQARWRFLSIFQQENPLGLFFHHYALHYSPGFLFFKGDANPLHSPPWGLVLVVLLPLVIWGGIAIARHPNKQTALLLFWFLTFAVPSSLTFDRYTLNSMPNALRATCGLGLLEMISVYGGMMLARQFSSQFMAHKKKLVGLFCFVVSVNFLIQAGLYVKYYPQRSAEAFQYGLSEAVHYIEANKHNYARIVVSPKVRLHPVSLAVFSGTPPRPLAAEDFPKYIIPFYNYVPVYDEFGLKRFQRYGSIGRWYTQAPEKTLLLVKPGEITVGEPSFQIEGVGNKVYYELYENREN